jgi:hypothetical protein
MVGPLEEIKLTLVPMYAEISQGLPPPRPFFNLLRFLRTHLCVASCERLSDCPPLLPGHFQHPPPGPVKPREARLSSASYRTDRPPVTKRYKIAAVPSDSQDAVGERPGRALGLTGAVDVAPHFVGFVAIDPERNGIIRRCCRRRTRSAVRWLGYPLQNRWKTRGGAGSEW